MFSSKKFFKLLIFRYWSPTRIKSPVFNVPFLTNRVATAPSPFFTPDSRTIPAAGPSWFVLNSSTSETNMMLSSKSGIPSPVLAETGIIWTSPPQSSGVNPIDARSLFTLSTSASGLSILFMATIISTPAAFAWS